MPNNSSKVCTDYSADDIAALSLMQTSFMRQGSTCWVTEENTYYTLIKDGFQPDPAGISVVAPLLPGGVWIRSLSGQPLGSFVFRPGDTSPSGNVYSDWNALYTALHATQGLRVVLIDDSIITPAVIPAGTYDMTDVTISGHFLKHVFLSISDGVVLQNLLHITDNLIVTDYSLSTVVPLLGPDMTVAIIERGAGLMLAPGAAPMFEIGPGSASVFSLVIGGTLDGTNGPLIKLDDASSAGLFVTGNISNIGSDIVTGPGQGLFLSISTSANVSHTQTLVGTAFFMLATKSSETGYAASSPGDWANPPPADAGAALDRLAAAVAGILGGPIP